LEKKQKLKEIAPKELKIATIKKKRRDLLHCATLPQFRGEKDGKTNV
jgi:hypothetical protein